MAQLLNQCFTFSNYIACNVLIMHHHNAVLIMCHVQFLTILTNRSVYLCLKYDNYRLLMSPKRDCFQGIEPLQVVCHSTVVNCTLLVTNLTRPVRVE